MKESPNTPQCQPVTPGELTIGDYLTVLEWNDPPNPLEALEKQGLEPMGPIPIPIRPQHMKGDVLEIKALSLPYILVCNLSDHDHGHIWDTMDTRDFRYKLLQPNFVDAMKENRKLIKAKNVEDREQAFANSQRLVNIQQGVPPQTKMSFPNLPPGQGDQVVRISDEDDNWDFDDGEGGTAVAIDPDNKPPTPRPSNQELLDRFLGKKDEDDDEKDEE